MQLEENRNVNESRDERGQSALMKGEIVGGWGVGGEGGGCRRMESGEVREQD